MDMTYEIERRYSEFDSLYQTVKFEKNPFKVKKNWSCSDFAQLPKSGVARFSKKKDFPKFVQGLPGRAENKVGRFPNYMKSRFN